MAIQVNYVRVSKYIVDSVRLITLFLLIYQMILKTFHHIYAYDMQKSLNIPGR
jgi:Na+-transporting NADH:ubiquinone oxidoreductase subunit NqrD